MKKSLIMLMIVFFFAIFVGCTKEIDDDSEVIYHDFMGVELTESEAMEVYNLTHGSGQSTGELPDLSFFDPLRNQSFFEIEHTKKDAYYLCGYIPNKYYGDEIIYTWLVLNIYGYETFWDTLKGESDFSYEKIKWYKFEENGIINEELDGTHFCFLIFEASYVNVYYDVLEEKEINFKKKVYLRCNHSRKDGLITAVSNYRYEENKKYLTIGNWYFDFDNEEKFFFAGGYKKDIMISEYDGNYALMDCFDINDVVDVDKEMKAKYKEHYETIKNSYLGFEISGENIHIYYDYYKYVDALKDIKEKELNENK